MILVTGATGNVGKELVPRLIDAGESVRLLVRDRAKVASVEASNQVEIAQGDLDRSETLMTAMEGVRAVYLIAFSTNQVENVLAAAGRAGVELIVRQSTIEAGPVPPIGPGKWHREQEQLIEDSGLRWIHLRPTMMTVNTVGWWAGSIWNQGCVFFPGGKGRVSPVAPRDIAAVAQSVLTQPGHDRRAYDITGPELLTVGEMVHVLSRVLKKPIQYQDVPEEAAAEWLGKSGLPDYVVAGLVETLAALRSNRFAYVADTVERLTGMPGQTYEAWCRENIDMFRGNL